MSDKASPLRLDPSLQSVQHSYFYLSSAAHVNIILIIDMINLNYP